MNQQEQVLSEQEIRKVLTSFIADLKAKPTSKSMIWIEEYDKGLVCGHWEIPK
jgi:hypothetical protein